jgi:multicomponent Na+:H+ antiporter subunit E
MKRIVLFIVTLVLWVLLTWTVDWQSLLVGMLASLLVTILFGNLFIQNPKKFLQINRWFWFFCYIFLFLWECIKANFDVAYRVLHPMMPIKPGIVKIKSSLKSDLAKTFLANSLTMQPGTLTVDIDGEYFFIHWIYVRETEVSNASQKITGKFEFLLAKIFD